MYIACHQNTVIQYIATRTIMDLFLEEKLNMGLILFRRWWDHLTLDILWIRTGYAAAEGGGVEESEREGKYGRLG